MKKNVLGSIVHSYLGSFIHSFIPSCVHYFIRSFIRSFENDWSTYLHCRTLFDHVMIQIW